MSKVTFVSADDWIGMYVDGQLKAQNHSLYPREVLEALGIEYELCELTDKELEEMGWELPLRWELPQEKESSYEPCWCNRTGCGGNGSCGYGAAG